MGHGRMESSLIDPISLIRLTPVNCNRECHARVAAILPDVRMRRARSQLFVRRCRLARPQRRPDGKILLPDQSIVVLSVDEIDS